MKACLLKILLIKYNEIILLSRKLIYTFVSKTCGMNVSLTFNTIITALKHKGHRVPACPLWFSFYIGFLTQFFPGLFITSPIQNKGQQITRLNKKCLCSNGIPVIIGLADQSKRMLKTVMTAILIGTRKVELGCKL